MCAFSTDYFAWDEPDAVVDRDRPSDGPSAIVTARVGYASAVRTGRRYSPVTA